MHCAKLRKNAIRPPPGGRLIISYFHFLRGFWISANYRFSAPIFCEWVAMSIEMLHSEGQQRLSIGCFSVCRCAYPQNDKPKIRKNKPAQKKVRKCTLRVHLRTPEGGGLFFLIFGLSRKKCAFCFLHLAQEQDRHLLFFLSHKPLLRMEVALNAPGLVPSVATLSFSLWLSSPAPRPPPHSGT